MELKSFFAQDLSGNVIPSPAVYLYEPGTTTLVTGLQTATGTALANPFTGTVQGQILLAAPDGDYDLRAVGSGRDFTMRVRFIDSIAGSADILRDDLADDTGAALIGVDDGASGSLFTTLAAFIALLLSSAGAAIVGFIQAGIGAIYRSVRDKLRERVSVKDYGAVGDGVADDYAAMIAADLAASVAGIGAVYFPPGKYRSTQKITNKKKKVAWYGDLGPTEAQGPADWTVAIVCDGPIGGAFITADAAPGEDANIEIHHLGFYTAGVSIDAIDGIVSLGKCTDVHHCSFLNFVEGVKTNGAVSKIYSNHINSCSIMIDCAGGESSVYDNHGYPSDTGVLIRGSGTKVWGNKIYGDGADAPYGIKVWGFGNTIFGNVIDAFTDVGIYLYSNSSGPYSSSNPACDQNVIFGNNISGTGDGGTYDAAIVVEALNGDISGNLITGNTIFNKRDDRVMKYGVLLVAASGKTNANTYVLNNTIANTTVLPVALSGAISGVGTKSGQRIRNNQGYITENTGTVAGYNALLVNHGLGATPTHVSVNPQSNLIYAVGADAFTSTTFRLLLRDNAGATVSSGSPVTCTWKAEV